MKKINFEKISQLLNVINENLTEFNDIYLQRSIDTLYLSNGYWMAIIKGDNFVLLKPWLEEFSLLKTYKTDFDFFIPVRYIDLAEKYKMFKERILSHKNSKMYVLLSDMNNLEEFIFNLNKDGIFIKYEFIETIRDIADRLKVCSASIVHYIPNTLEPIYVENEGIDFLIAPFNQNSGDCYADTKDELLQKSYV